MHADTIHLELPEAPEVTPVQRIRFNLSGDSEIQHMNVLGGDLWSVRTSGSGASVIGLTDLARAKRCTVEELFDGATSLAATRELLDIDPSASATEDILREMFGPEARMDVTLEASVDGGSPELLFEIHTPRRPSLAERNAFLGRYIEEVPRPTREPLPTLVWNPVRADQPT